MLLPPDDNGLQYRLEALPFLCQEILIACGFLLIHPSAYKASAF